MKKKKERQIKADPDVPKPSQLPKHVGVPHVFQRPPMKNTVSPGFRIRQDQRSRFFSRTRRGI